MAVSDRPARVVLSLERILAEAPKLRERYDRDPEFAAAARRYWSAISQGATVLG